MELEVGSILFGDLSELQQAPAAAACSSRVGGAVVKAVKCDECGLMVELFRHGVCHSCYEKVLG